jgi:hypothetical protein
MVEAVMARLRRLFLPLALLIALLALPSTAHAHRLDEYLQATLVPIEPGDIRLQMNFTPGVAVAEPIIALIDRDRDGVISPDEAAAYAESLKHDLTVRLDGRDVELNLTASNFPAIPELRSGSGIIQIEFAVHPGPIAAGAHRLSLQNRHLPPVSAYLFNAARPRSGSVHITRQTRNDNQSVGDTAFTVDGPPKPSGAVALIASLAALLVAVFAGMWRARKSAASPT